MTEATANAGAAAPPRPPLDDVMLAMDVVDTLRRRERLVQQELDDAGRAQDLKERLRRIYAAQGIEVSDAILEEGVQALKQDRFVYKPPPDGLKMRLARIYVTRHRWGKWGLSALALLVIGIAAWIALVVAPRHALPHDLQARHDEVIEVAADPAVDARADELLAAGEAALRSGDDGRARAVLAELRQMRDQLEASYRLVVINDPGKMSGVWRVPASNPSARNYYLIVEAIGPSGRPIKVPIVNEETGKTELVSRWGLRVDETTFQRVAADKEDDGIIQANILGRKAAGQLEPDYAVPTTGAAITQW
jgi:hypothetical protein